MRRYPLIPPRGCFLVIHRRNIALPRILRYADEAGLILVEWTLCLGHSGGSAGVFGRNIIADWKQSFSWFKIVGADLRRADLIGSNLGRSYELTISMDEAKTRGAYS